MSNELFEDMEMTFLDPVSEKKRQVKQGYYDYLASIVIAGEGLLPDPLDPDELVQRKITPEEEEELYYKIGVWLNSLN